MGVRLATFELSCDMCAGMKAIENAVCLQASFGGWKCAPLGRALDKAAEITAHPWGALRSPRARFGLLGLLFFELFCWLS